jgi:lysophospholipase L1-like esterase
MSIRIIASIALVAGLAWGCGSPDLSAAETEPTGTSSGDTSPSVVAAAPSTTAQSVPRSSQSSATGTTTTAPATATPATATPTPSPLLTRTARILALGDSMTAGHEDDPTRFRSYRGKLFALLVAAGYKVDFVGTQKMTPAVGGDPDHDGYGGAWIGPGGSTNNLTDKLPGILAAVDPDIIILAFGWNSVYNEASVAGAKYRDFVNRVAAAKPNAHIVVATMSPQRGQTEARSSAELPGYAAINSVARSIASASTTDRIHLADYASAGFQDSEYWDVIHWLQPGADRAAQVLYQTLVNGPLKR